MLQEAFDRMAAQFGLDYAKQQRWQHWLAAAFDAQRKPGVKVNLYTDYKPAPRVWERVKEKPVDGMGIVEAWVGNEGIAALLDCEADQAACMACVAAMFKADKWPLRE